MYSLLHDRVTQYTDQVFSFLKKGILKHTVTQASIFLTCLRIVNFSGNVTNDLICQSYCYIFLMVKFV